MGHSAQAARGNRLAHTHPDRTMRTLSRVRFDKESNFKVPKLAVRLILTRILKVTELC